MTTNATDIYEKKFPAMAKLYSLKPFQEEVINHVIKNGSTLAIMPTGGGKSLIYWVTAVAPEFEGTCLVVSPLIALIDEQTEKLRNEGFSVLAIHSGMGASEQMKHLKEFATGESTQDFIFVSPERMATDGFFEYCISLQKDKIKLVVIDEIHCVSQWGLDFRPFYKQIPAFLNTVFKKKWPVILGLTATINPRELTDIRADFNISEKSVIKNKVLLRMNLNLNVEKLSDETEKEKRLWEIIEEHPNEKILVYQYRKTGKRNVEDLCEDANRKGLRALAFHGDMSSGERQEVINKVLNDSHNVIFATNAFGMGLDIPDIRVVIHFMLPGSIEQYYQEVGRAGRDGKEAIAYLLYSNRNVEVRKSYFIDNAFPAEDDIKVLFKKTTNNEIGKRTLQYFAEEDLQNILPYFLNCGVISILGKGFTRINIFEKNVNQQLQKMICSSKTGMVDFILSKPEFASLGCQEFFYVAYEAITKEEARLSKGLDKCIVIEALEKELTEKQLDDIKKEMNSKKEYKHNLFDYFVYILNNFENSDSLRQEIGKYLGVPKHELGKIYQTENGILVRSKSEVIIANILYRSNLDFEYEAKLNYDEKHWKEPDFTIKYNGKTWYWEHLGLLDDPQYNEDWREKKQIYTALGIIDNLIITKESAILSNNVNEWVKKIKI